MIKIYKVRPGDEEIASSRVAVWDQATIHVEVDKRWAVFGGAHIVGDPANPGAEYVVAATPGIDDAVRARRLVVIDTDYFDETATPPEADESKDEPDSGSESGGTGSARSRSRSRQTDKQDETPQE